eukprot:PLAT9994.1.p1 GENE.PLAT9994.1~~PLAT9994.1.p1  ORF type:complete len:483 (-),score=201.61 PLAT9994.1:91-1446(-)
MEDRKEPRLRYGVYSLLGRRESLEDTHRVCLDLREESGYGPDGAALFSLFDGHGGAACSEFLADTFHRTVGQAMERTSDVTAALIASIFDSEQAWRDAVLPRVEEEVAAALRGRSVASRRPWPASSKSSSRRRAMRAAKSGSTSTRRRKRQKAGRSAAAARSRDRRRTMEGEAALDDAVVEEEAASDADDGEEGGDRAGDAAAASGAPEAGKRADEDSKGDDEAEAEDAPLSEEEAAAAAAALKQGRVEMSKQVRDLLRAGSCAVACVLHNNLLFCVNVGDSRAVLCRSGRALPLSIDQKPGRADERARIKLAGGRVDYTKYGVGDEACCAGLCRPTTDAPLRIYPGGIAVSRAVGDIVLKDPRFGVVPCSGLLSATPEVTVTTITEADELAVIACDGLWDVMSSEQAVKLARTCRTPQAAAELLTQSAYHAGSTDNITVIVLFFWDYTAE